MIHQYLAEGRQVYYRSSGYSLVPRVHPNDRCGYESATDPRVFERLLQNEDNWNEPWIHQRDKWDAKDIVFCQPQPKNFYTAHIIKRIHPLPDGTHRFVISNYKGRENGWCERRHIYGRLFEVNDEAV